MINKDNHKVTVYDEEIKLTPIEFDILYLLRPIRPRPSAQTRFSRRYGMKRIYEANNTVMVHIRRLRGKDEGGHQTEQDYHYRMGGRLQN